LCLNLRYQQAKYDKRGQPRIIMFGPDLHLQRVLMAKKENRIVITLACTECGDRNYTTTKNRKNDTNRLELMKYCPRLRKRTLHRETK